MRCHKTGLDFLENLRAVGITVILFTGKGREEVAVKTLNLGADGVNKTRQRRYGELCITYVNL